MPQCLRPSVSLECQSRRDRVLVWNATVSATTYWFGMPLRLGVSPRLNAIVCKVSTGRNATVPATECWFECHGACDRYLFECHGACDRVLVGMPQCLRPRACWNATVPATSYWLECHGACDHVLVGMPRPPATTYVSECHPKSVDCQTLECHSESVDCSPSNGPRRR